MILALFSLRLASIAHLGMVLIAFGLAPLPLKASAFDHSIFDAVLKTHVKDGLVRYAALKSEPRLDVYLAKLAAAKPEALSGRAEQIAFWINAYNAYTLKLIVDHHPVASIRDIPHAGAESVWDLPVARVAGATYSLNAIEHEILRGQYKEPLIHYAVVCAAVSCPTLRAEAFTGDCLYEQIGEQARSFLASHNRFDGKTRRAQLSQIFQWFAVDFGGDAPAVLAALAPFAPEAVSKSLAQGSAGWTVVYLDYDWALNEAR